MTDVADRHLRDKTDAIAYIIRNISEQCAAAVEGLDLARRADTSSTTSGDDDRSESGKKRSKRPVKKMSGSMDGESQTNASESEFGDANSDTSGYLRPNRGSNIPPTPDLVNDRSSTSMSLGSESLAVTPQRQSVNSQFSNRSQREDVPAVPTRIIDNEDDLSTEDVAEPVTKFNSTPVPGQQLQTTAQ
jgi:hypothetical protein